MAENSSGEGRRGAKRISQDPLRKSIDKAGNESPVTLQGGLEEANQYNHHVNNNTGTEQLGNQLNNENVCERSQTSEIANKHVTILTAASVDKSIHKDTREGDTHGGDGGTSKDEGDISEARRPSRQGYQVVAGRSQRFEATSIEHVHDTVAEIDRHVDSSEDEKFSTFIPERSYDASRSRLVTGQTPLVVVEESTSYDVSTSELVLPRHSQRQRTHSFIPADQEMWSALSHHLNLELSSPEPYSSLSNPLPFYCMYNMPTPAWYS